MDLIYKGNTPLIGRLLAFSVSNFWAIFLTWFLFLCPHHVLPALHVIEQRLPTLTSWKINCSPHRSLTSFPHFCHSLRITTLELRFTNNKIEHLQKTRRSNRHLRTQQYPRPIAELSACAYLYPCLRSRGVWRGHAALFVYRTDDCHLYLRTRHFFLPLLSVWKRKSESV